MSLGGPGGSGPGEGGFGGGVGFGGPGTSGGDGPSGASSADINSALDDFFGDVDKASAALRGGKETISMQAKAFRGLAVAFASILGGLAMGIPGALLAGKLAAKGMSLADAQAMVESVQSGQMSPEQAAQRGASEAVFGNPDGGPADTEQGGGGKNGKNKNGKNKVTDPKDPSFWEQFVEEWQSAKENIRLNDEFKKTALSPAFDTYQQRLAGLSNEDTFKPINIKMGDFETSFTTKRSAQNAGNILSSEIAEADVMAPKSAEMSYLDRLQGIATTEKGWQNQKDIAKITKKMPNDQGSTTDAITDWLGIVKGGSDLIDSIW